jgi:hypothetical protein
MRVTAAGVVGLTPQGIVLIHAAAEAEVKETAAIAAVGFIRHSGGNEQNVDDVGRFGPAHGGFGRFAAAVSSQILSSYAVHQSFLTASSRYARERSTADHIAPFDNRLHPCSDNSEDLHGRQRGAECWHSGRRFSPDWDSTVQKGNDG